jgi:hypothetical protein
MKRENICPQMIMELVLALEQIAKNQERGGSCIGDLSGKKLSNNGGDSRCSICVAMRFRYSNLHVFNSNELPARLQRMKLFMNIFDQRISVSGLHSLLRIVDM